MSMSLPYRRGMSGGRDVSFIIAMNSSKSLTSFAYCFFHFRKPPGSRLAFDAVERNGRLGCIQCQKGRVQQQRKEKVWSIPLVGQ